MQLTICSYMFNSSLQLHTHTLTPISQSIRNKPTDWRKATLGSKPKPLYCCCGVIFFLVCFTVKGRIAIKTPWIYRKWLPHMQLMDALPQYKQHHEIYRYETV